MPRTLWVSRARTYAHIQSPPPPQDASPSLVQRARRLFGGRADFESAADGPIGDGEWRRALDGLRTADDPNGGVRVFHDDGAPWFLASFDRDVSGVGGHVQLAVSRSSPRFVDDWTALLPVAVDIADRLSARVYDEDGGRPITRESLPSLTAADGDYRRTQAERWEAFMNDVLRKGLAPLEFPTGETDVVRDYFQFDAPAPPGDLAAALGSLPDGLRVEADGPTYWLARDGRRVAFVARAPDGRVHLSPAWRHGAFRDTAPVVVAVVRTLVDRHGGDAGFLGRATPRELLDELAERSRGLGCDFWAWRQEQSDDTTIP